MQEHANKNTKQTSKKDLAIYKLRGVSQYVLYSGTSQVNFILEEDAQRFARHLTGSELDYPVREM